MSSNTTAAELPPRPEGYRPEIDGLRAVAVLAVIANHFHEPLLPSGYLGVDIFFVISGFVITRSFRSLNADSLGSFLLAFYVRRVRRLVPALVLCVVPTALLLCLVSPNPYDSLKTGAASLFGLSNLYLLRLRSDYFGDSTTLNAFTQSWSLGVEEQFYVLYPVLAFVAGVRGHRARTNRGLEWTLGLLGLLSLAGFAWLGGPQSPTAFFLMPMRFWELGAGALLYLIGERTAPTEAQTRLRAPVLLLALIGSLLLPLEAGTIATALVVALTVALMHALSARSVAYDVLTLPATLYVGRISYSLYLWHWSVLCLSRWSFGVTAESAPFQLGLMFVLAHVSYRFVETPLRHRAWSPSGALTLCYALGSSVLAAGLLAFLSFGGAQQLSLDRRYPSPLFAQLQAARAWGRAEDHGCHISFQVTRERARSCLTPNAPEHQPRVYVLGDSHAGHYLKALTELMPQASVRGFTAGWGCGVLAPEDVRPGGPPTFRCADYIGVVNSLFERGLRAGDWVVIGHVWLGKPTHPHLRESLERAADAIVARGARLLLIDDVAGLDVETPFLCERRPWRPVTSPTCNKSLARVVDDQREQDALRQRIASTRTGVYALALRTLYCDAQGTCGPELNGTPIYRDVGHLSHAASFVGARAIVAFIAEHSAR